MVAADAGLAIELAGRDAGALAVAVLHIMSVQTNRNIILRRLDRGANGSRTVAW